MLSGVVENALNVSMDFQVGKEKEYLKGFAAFELRVSVHVG
jgi:hypothetical protein